MNILDKKSGWFFGIIINILLYFIVFLLIFFIIYRAYIYRFSLKPIPCMNDRCIKERTN